MNKRKYEEEIDRIEAEQKDGERSASKSKMVSLYPKKGRINPKEGFYVRCRPKASLAYEDPPSPVLPAGQVITILEDEGPFYKILAVRGDKTIEGFVLKSLCVLEE